MTALGFRPMAEPCLSPQMGEEPFSLHGLRAVARAKSPLPTRERRLAARRLSWRMASEPTTTPTLATLSTTPPVPRPQRLWPGLALATAGSIAFSGKAIIVKLAYRHGVDAGTLIMYRMLFALPLFVGLAWG